MADDNDDNIQNGDAGDCYRKDGYIYYKKFGDAFRYKERDKRTTFNKKFDDISKSTAIKTLSIVEDIEVKNIYLKEHLQSSFDVFMFTNCKFTGQLHLPKEFYKELIFENCIFDDAIYSLEVKFSKQIVFDNCRFKNVVNFSKSQFNDSVSFFKSKFGNVADFNNVLFNKDASFSFTRFHKKAVFTNATFNKIADFSKMIVFNNTGSGFYFENNNKTPDTAEIIFNDTEFEAPIFFNGRCFKEKISFTNTLINNTFNFSDVDFGSTAQLSTMKINYHKIPDAELWINILNNNIKNKYLAISQKLTEISKDIIKNSSNLTNNKITEDDNNILISRKDTSVMLGIPANTLKTWTARGKSELVFKNEGDQCGYTLASIKEYKKANPNINKIKNKEEEPVSTYATYIENNSVISSNDSYIKTTRKLHERHYSHLPIIENKTIVGIFSNRIESEFTYRRKMYPNTNLQELTIKEMLDIVGNSIEGFLFTKPKTKVKEVKQMFIQDSQYEEGIGVVFLTSNGKADGELVGMVRLKDLIRI